MIKPGILWSVALVVVGGIIGGLLGAYITANHFAAMMTDDRELSEAASIKKRILRYSRKLKKETLKKPLP